MSTPYICEQVFGWCGTVLCICWALSGATLGIYTIVENISIPIIVQPHCYGSLCAIIYCQMLYYDKQWRWYSAVAAFAAYAVVTAGCEVGFVFASRFVEHHHHSNGLTMLWGILSAVFLLVGFFPQFYEIRQAKEVFGVSYLFLFMDSLGAVFSIMSLGFKDYFDGIAFAGYASVLICEIAIVGLALYLNPRTRRARHELASSPPTQDSSRARSPVDDAEKQVVVPTDSGVVGSSVRTCETGPDRRSEIAV
ncbi:hypothetical protein Rhopal_000780-T1 [Rhodotorula paludigena]|uniref:Uncharacterized protein n=1 Tax=Rhodotorula paludigena TaxID=86838 RepID=A0AAV5GDU0_9BASI|nr:hypothetical protein Rhopal_000780-T1 [Rhodotorula paludigena]